MPLPEGRKGYTKTRPIQFEDFAACVVWWTNRTENEYAWKIDFHELRRSALERAKPLWDAATKAEEQAKVHAKAAREIATQLQNSQETAGPQSSGTKNKANDRKQIEDLRNRLNEQSEAEKAQRELAKAKQIEGDAIYSPIFNLDCKNPNAKDDFEHSPPEQLVDDILKRELRIAEIMGEIKELLGRIP